MEETHQNRQRCTLNFLLTRAKHLNNYCKAYRQKLEAYVADETAPTPQDQKNSTGTKLPVSAAIIDDTAFMKQIEHDSQFTYHELHLFRETVYRNMIHEKDEERKKKEKAAGLQTDGESTPDTFEVVSPDTEYKKVNDEVDVNPDNPGAEQGPGLYGWISSWFSGGQTSGKCSLDCKI